MNKKLKYVKKNIMGNLSVIFKLFKFKLCKKTLMKPILNILLTTFCSFRLIQYENVKPYTRVSCDTKNCFMTNK